MGKKNTPQLYYKIQIAAYRNLNLAQLSPLGNIGKLFAEDAGNGIKRVIMGYYTTRTQAEALLPRVHEQGFSTAFVTPHQSIVPNDSTAIAFAPAATKLLRPSPTQRNRQHTSVSVRRAVAFGR